MRYSQSQCAMTTWVNIQTFPRSTVNMAIDNANMISLITIVMFAQSFTIYNILANVINCKKSLTLTIKVKVIAEKRTWAIRLKMSASNLVMFSVLCVSGNMRLGKKVTHIYTYTHTYTRTRTRTRSRTRTRTRTHQLLHKQQEVGVVTIGNYAKQICHKSCCDIVEG